ncbi:MAG: HDOD domain-containing protein [Thiohalomonadales bacterium]
MTPDTLISENLTLLSMPEIVVKLNSMLEDPDCTAADIGNEISLDPALTIRVLKIVNSALYHLPNQVKNIPMAITILGILQLRNIVMTTSVIKKFQSIPPDLVNMDTFWRHSISCAIASRIMANYCKLKDAEDFFVMGLLHDIGKLVMYLVLPDQSREVLCEMRSLKEKSSDADVSNIEKSHFGFSHAILGRILTQQWNMPDSQTTPIAEHHLPYSQFTMVESTAILKIADYLSNQIQPLISPDEIEYLENECISILKLDEDKLLNIQEQTKNILEETISLVYN